MKYEIIFAPEAIRDLKRLSARNRSIIGDAIEKHLRVEPDKVSKSRIKRLHGIRRPQYRLRVDDIRVFYDIVETDVEILAIVEKPDVAAWLAEMGETE
jgi:mRNA-degrading endonuclease RelE of RelBE toxin-antitoxin system